MATKTVADYSTIGPMGHHSPPRWWHSHGNKLRLTDGIARQWQTIESSAAKLIVTRYKSVWRLQWQISHAGAKSQGEATVSTIGLKLMFGLQVSRKDLATSMPCHWMVEDYGAEFGSQRLFIRWGRYLNLPHPGTRHDGDPNLSLYVTEEIQEAIWALINEK